MGREDEGSWADIDGSVSLTLRLWDWKFLTQLCLKDVDRFGHDKG